MLSLFYRLQQMFLPWMIMGSTAFILNLIAHHIFQNAMGLPPCEYCVYIRFSMFCIFFGCVLCAIYPRGIVFRVVFGYILNGYGIIQGAIWNMKLANIEWTLAKIEAGGDFFALGAASSLCSLTPKFPFGLQLDKCCPGWFLPTGGCGAIDWDFMGFGMAECLFIFYGLYLLIFVLIVVSGVYGGLKKAFVH